MRVALLSVFGGVISGLLVDNYVDEVYIWGGTVCDEVTAGSVCYGYAPGGLLLLVLGLFFILKYLQRVFLLRLATNE